MKVAVPRAVAAVLFLNLSRRPVVDAQAVAAIIRPPCRPLLRQAEAVPVAEPQPRTNRSTTRWVRITTRLRLLPQKEACRIRRSNRFPVATKARRQVARQSRKFNGCHDNCDRAAALENSQHTGSFAGVSFYWTVLSEADWTVSAPKVCDSIAQANGLGL